VFQTQVDGWTRAELLLSGLAGRECYPPPELSGVYEEAGVMSVGTPIRMKMKR